MTTYTSLRVPVRGGDIAGGIWTPEVGADRPPVLAIHGITASHLSWPLVAEQLGTRVVALDLRGRGRSNKLPGPFDLRSYAEDMRTVMDHLALERVVVAGHSMGAFVAVCLAQMEPARVASLVLIDGGLPLAPPAGVAPEDLPALVLGPALERLSMTFTSRAEYAHFWRSHPALGPYWNDTIEAYVDYDLDGTPPHLSPSSNPDAVAENALQLDGEGGYSEALVGLSVPVDFLHAPRGLADQVPPLYPNADISRLAEHLPGICFHEIDDVNHYTIVLGPGGAAQVAAVIENRVSEEQAARAASTEVST